MDEFIEESDSEKIARNFPTLVEHRDYEITSECTPEYNCLSWALGIDWGFYDPLIRHAGYTWFPGVEREWTSGAIRKIFAKLGYTQESENTDIEAGFQKVAFYLEEDGTPNHFARQLSNGKWTSKLGSLNDIEHISAECLEPAYGSIQIVLKRKIDTASEIINSPQPIISDSQP